MNDTLRVLLDNLRQVDKAIEYNQSNIRGPSERAFRFLHNQRDGILNIIKEIVNG